MGNVWEITLRLFKWVEETSQFNEDFIKSYNKDGYIGYFLRVVVQNTEKLHELHNEVLLIPKRMKTGKAEKTFSQVV